jgi:hypothetical protein
MAEQPWTEHTWDAQIRREVAHVQNRVVHVLVWTPTPEELQDLKQGMLHDVWGVCGATSKGA